MLGSSVVRNGDRRRRPCLGRRRPPVGKEWGYGIMAAPFAPEPKRESMAASPVIDALRELVGDRRLLTDPDALQQYGRDWTRAWGPAPLAVVLPESVDEVQAIVRLANRLGVALVPSGGRTGLSGGAVARAGEVVVALDRMDQVLEFDPVDRQVTVEACMITARLQEYAAEPGLFSTGDFDYAGYCPVGCIRDTYVGSVHVVSCGTYLYTIYDE